jgi:hypothetical protein
MKKINLDKKRRKMLLIFCAVIVTILCLVLLIIRSPEDDWIKDEQGVWVKHGAPSEGSEEVEEQQEAIFCALALYQKRKSAGADFSGQCLGTCGDYAVDIVHVPRSGEDNLAENQCEDYRMRRVKHFIELNKGGEIVRIE